VFFTDLHNADTAVTTFNFVQSHCKRQVRRDVDLFLAGKPCNPFNLPAAVRHVFAHGILTPNAAGVDPAVLANICSISSDLLFLVMDREFEKRMKRFKLTFGLP